MCIRHQKRPQKQARKSGLHAHPNVVAPSVNGMPSGPGDDNHAGKMLKLAEIEDLPKRKHGKKNGSDRQRVTERDRNECQPDYALTMAVEPERRREQPTHRGVDAVKRAKSGDGKPQP